jgi:hypothetical protein
MITTSENATQKSITRPRLSVHHTSFLWALCHEFVRSDYLHDPAFRSLQRGGLAPLSDHAAQTAGL